MGNGGLETVTGLHCVDIVASFPGFTRTLVLVIFLIGLSMSARVKPGNEAMTLQTQNVYVPNEAKKRKTKVSSLGNCDCHHQDATLVQQAYQMFLVK